ncbi:MAG TPA: hypothetical protein VNT20_18255 [Flavisolibacter sp.]|jgi:hypothetical protein|nr:hypothetical protein [Flavisolibacter sp.]
MKTEEAGVPVFSVSEIVGHKTDIMTIYPTTSLAKMIKEQIRFSSSALLKMKSK